MKCPKCGSDQLTSHQQGFGAKKAVGGFLVAGPFGLFAGAINKNKLMVACMNCGFQWRPMPKPDMTKEGIAKSKSKEKDQLITALLVLVAVVGCIIYMVVTS